jgi:hypothetical protein
MPLTVPGWARSVLRAAGLALPPIRRLYNAHNALIAERNALAAELAANRAAPVERLATLQSPASCHLEDIGQCCLYTAYNQDFARVAAYTVPAMRRYAEKYGFDFAEHVDPICERPIAWSKLYLARDKFAQGYDTIFWIDADALIRRFDEDIRGHIDGNHEFYFVKEEFHKFKAKSRLNSGVFLMRKSEIADQFLEAVLNRAEFTNHYWWEQAAVLAEFGLWSNFEEEELHRPDEPNRFISRLKLLPARWNSFMGFDLDPAAIVHHFIVLNNDAKAVALGIDAIFDQMGPRDAVREEHFRAVIRTLLALPNSRWAR